MQPLRPFSLFTLEVGRARRIREIRGTRLAQWKVRNGPLLQQPEHFI